MRIHQIDVYCDAYEQRLRVGEVLTAEKFLHEQALAPTRELLEELRKVELEYQQRRQGGAAPQGPLAAVECPTVAMPADSGSQVIGPYKLLQKLGEGGMGVVYMADQTKPVARRVALKIIKPGMDSRQVIARFEAERQALSLMDHPNIARVLDAGTTDAGLPYFVMELVKGIPITRYCDEQRLNPRERLELFVPICLAVQHAHQKGIIHRDLKPSNVLVAQFDDLPVPKIIDFGLAKAVGPQLTEHTMFTQYGQIVGTIDYMSPEQASFNQLDVDTRTDIYSLGVLLYELLTGETPFDKQRLHKAAFDELLRIIRQEEPPRPSARLSSNESLPTIASNRRIEPKKLSVLVRGELDWIVMKALEKDRVRRYETANGLALDVQRYLADEAVAACPPSLGYQVRKFVRRHKVAMWTAAGLGFALLLGLIGTSWQAIRATLAERDLTTQRNRATNAEGLANRRLAAAEASESRAVAALKQAEVSLFDMTTSFGLAAAERHEAAEAVLWFAEAASLAQPDSAEERESRIRAQSWSRLAPSPVRAIWHEADEKFDWVGFDATGDRFATLTKTGTCTIWNLADNGSRRIEGKILCATWSPTGSELAVGLTGQTVQLLDGHTGSLLESIALGSNVTALAYSPDGSTLAVASRNVRLWSLRSGRFLHHNWLHPAPVRSLRFSPDGTRILTTCSDAHARLFDVASPSSLPLLPPAPHNNSYRFAPPVFVDQGRGFVTAMIDSAGSRTRRYDATTGQTIREISFYGPGIICLTSSPDGRFVAVGGYDNGQIWDCETNRPVIDDIPGTIISAAMSPDGAEVALGALDGSIQRWSTQTGAKIGAALPALGFVEDLEYSPDGRRLAAIQGDFLATVWLINGRKSTRGDGVPIIADARIRSESLGGKGTDLTVSDSGELLMPTGSNAWWGDLRRTRVYRASDLQPLGPYLLPEALLVDACFSPDERSVATASVFHEIIVWDWRTGTRRLPPVKVPQEPISVDYTGDGKFLVVLCVGGSIQILEAASGNLIRTLSEGAQDVPQHFRELAFHYFPPGSPARQWQCLLSRDGQWLVRCSLRNPNVYVWNVATGSLRYDPLLQDGGGGPLALSSDDQLLATAHEFQVHLRDFHTGRTIGEPLAHPDFLHFLQFSPDGQQLLTGCRDGVARLWDCQTGRMVGSPMKCSATTGHDDGDCGVFCGTNDELILTASRDLTARLWSRKSGKLLAPETPISSHGSSIALAPGATRAFVSGYASSSSSSRLPWTGRAIDSVPLEEMTATDSLPREEWKTWAEILSGRQVVGAGSSRLDPEIWLRRFHAFQSRHPERFPIDWPRDDVIAWHQSQLRETQRVTDESLRAYWFASDWHWSRLSRLVDPSDRRYVTSQIETNARRATDQLRARDLKAALAAMQPILEASTDAPVAPGTIDVALGIGSGLASDRDGSAAQEHLQKLIALQRRLYGDRDYLTTLSLEYLAKLRWLKKDHDDAIATMRDVILRREAILGSDTHQTQSPTVLLSHWLNSIGRHREAISLFDEMLQRNPNSVGAIDKLAWGLVTSPDPGLWDPERAVRLTNRANELRPGNNVLTNTLGVAQLRQGRFKEAIETLERSDELDRARELSFYGFFLAIAYYRSGDVQKAREWYLKAKQWMDEKMPQDPELIRFRQEAESVLQSVLDAPTQP